MVYSFSSKAMQCFYLRLITAGLLWIYPCYRVSAADWWGWWDSSVSESSPSTDQISFPSQDNETISAPEADDNPVDDRPALFYDADVAAVMTKRSFSTAFLMYSLADWINTLHTASLAEQIGKYSCKNNECFINYQAFDENHMCLQAYGLCSDYNGSIQHATPCRKINFSLSTGGIGTDYGALLTDRIKVGSGLGYFYSKLHWNHKKNVDHINGIYLDPYVEYFFRDGSIRFTFYGISNFHQADQEADQRKKNNFMSYDLAMRLESGYVLDFPANFFIKNGYIYPHLRLDYMSVFISKHEKISGIKIKGNHSAFLQSELSLLMSKTILIHKESCFLFNIDVGWVRMAPLFTPSLVIANQREKNKINNPKLEIKNQCALSVELMRIQKVGPALSIKYEAWVGQSTSTHLGRMKAEWSW